MSIKVIKRFIRLIIVLMVCECFLAAFATVPPCYSDQLSIDAKSFSSYLSICLLSETEEGKYEEDPKTGHIEIEDLKKTSLFLSKLHTPPKRFIVFGHRDDHHPSWTKLFKVFRI